MHLVPTTQQILYCYFSFNITINDWCLFLDRSLIFYTRLIQFGVAFGLKPIQPVTGRSQGHSETNETNNQLHTLLGSILKSSIKPKCVFGQWEEGRVPGENPRIQGRTFKLHTERPGTLLL